MKNSPRGKSGQTNRRKGSDPTTPGPGGRARTRITVALTSADRELLQSIATARGLTPSAAVRELIRAADPDRKPDPGEQPAVATDQELLELLTGMARGGDRQAIKDLARMRRAAPRPPEEQPTDDEAEAEPDPADRFRAAMRRGGLTVVDGAGA